MSLLPSDLIAVLDSLLEGIQVVGPDWKYLHLNEAAARHGKSSREALLGRTMMECYPGIEETEMFALMRRCLEERTAHALENAFKFADGSIGYFELRIEPVPQGVGVLSIDVTARRRAEEAKAQAEERLRHAQKLDAIGQLAAGIAHDFNNLLTAIMGQAEVALERPEGPTRADVETMLNAARSSAQLTRQLLTYGRHTVLTREVLDLADVLQGMEGFLRAALASRVELCIDAPTGLGQIDADRSQLEQVVMNLIVNARDAIVGTGRISVSLEASDLDGDAAQEHPGSKPGPHVVLVVSDNGAGMDVATRERIFEPFFTTKEKGRGTGLGLANVYGIVQQHAGHIWVYSEPGKGTTFKVYFPVTNRLTVEAPVKASASSPAPFLRAQTQGAILVAEDDAILRRLLENVLSAAGYRLLLAARGDEALTLWEAHRPTIALLVTDITLPGLPGPELIRRMREQRPHLPVICTSGYSDAELARRGSLPTGVTFLEKPFSPKLLRQRVHEILSGIQDRSDEGG